MQSREVRYNRIWALSTRWANDRSGAAEARRADGRLPRAEETLRRLAFLTGMFGAGLALVGAMLAMFVGSVGLVTGGGLDAVSQLLRGLLASGAALIGGLAAVVALFRPRAAAAMLAVSIAVGLAAIEFYFVIGAIPLLMAAYFAFRADSAATRSKDKP